MKKKVRVKLFNLLLQGQKTVALIPTICWQKNEDMTGLSIIIFNWELQVNRSNF